MKSANIASVVFSGGGARCLWQSGFWKEISGSNHLNPAVFACASAGATIACITLAGKAEFGLQYFMEKTLRNRKNIYLENLIRKAPVFPHYDIYRQAIHDIFSCDDLKRLREGPEIRVLISRPPWFLGARSGTAIGIAAYAFEKKFFYPMHPQLASKLGFTATVVRVRDCQTVNDLASLLLQSSCTPPFVPVLKRDGRPTLDGGLIDNVPVRLLDDQPGDKLILLSRRYPENRIPVVPGCYYIQPSEPITIDKWDYTDPEGLQQAYELGRKDGKVYRERMT